MAEVGIHEIKDHGKSFIKKHIAPKPRRLKEKGKLKVIRVEELLRNS